MVNRLKCSKIGLFKFLGERNLLYPGFSTGSLDRNKIIGFYRYTKWPREDEKTETIHLFDISILPERQKQGLGTILMKDLFKDCKTNGYKKVFSRSYKNNESSIRFHKSTGFTLHIETEDSFIWEISL